MQSPHNQSKKEQTQKPIYTKPPFSAQFLVLILYLSPVMFFLFASQLSAQSVDIGAAIKLRYFLGGKEASSNFTTSLAIGIGRQLSFGKKDKLYYLPTYQIAFNMYNNGLGTNLLKAYRRTQLDIVNTLSITGGYRSGKEEYIYNFKAFNMMTATSFQHDLGEASMVLSTSFIANSNKRNQHIAYLGVSAWMVRVGYYNDGKPFDALPLQLVDNYDRWWTGGGFVQIGTDDIGPTNRGWRKYQAFVSYDRFTGDVQDAYKLSTRLSLTYVPAKKRSENFNNRAQTTIGLKHSDGWGLSYNWLGHFKFDVQDFIHRRMGFARHFSYADNYRLLGITYNNPLLKKQIKLP